MKPSRVGVDEPAVLARWRRRLNKLDERRSFLLRDILLLLVVVNLASIPLTLVLLPVFAILIVVFVIELLIR